MIKIPAKKEFPKGVLIFLALTIIAGLRIYNNIGAHTDYFMVFSYITFLLVGIVFAIVALLTWLKINFGSNTCVVVSNSGLFENLNIFSCGAISWNEIAGTSIAYTNVSEILVIHLKNNQSFLLRKNLIGRLILKRVIKKWGSPVVIYGQRIDYPLSDLQILIAEHIQVS